MKKSTLLVFSFLCGIGLYAQTTVNAPVQQSSPKNDYRVPEHRTCGVLEHEDYLQQNNPNRAAEVQAFEAQTAAWIASHQNQISTQAAINIPVVVHVIYNNAAQNISNNQVFSQIQVLNEDFTATNADVSSVPGVWTSLVANVDVNFCLAQQDPAGNPTNGIHRVSTSTASFSTNDAVKFTASGGTNAWDPTRYFNIWVCNLGGGLLGYAEFPTGTVSQTYGLVVGYTCFGSNFTSYGSGFNLIAAYNRGRTATHEIGHCFNLRHIWGDDGTACTGSDLVADTPNQADQNYGCPTFPNVSCSNGPNGDMHMNYMDYTDDACMFMFTNGQRTRMLAVINSTPYNTLQTSNACTPPASAPPVALFSTPTPAVCPGTPVTFTDGSTVNTTSWSWTFPSGTPATSNAQNPAPVTWSTPGTYTVTLIASNVNGSSTYTMAITILGPVNPPLVEGFEGTTYPPSGWTLYDAGNNGQVWQRFNAGRNSSWSSKFDNYNINVNGLRDDVRTPRMNFSTAATATLTFDVAYRRYNTNPVNSDTLEVLVSTDCGATWTQVWIKGGATLATVTGTQTTAFTPTNAQWRNENVSLNTYAGNGGVMIAFRNRGHYGNNIYVDNVNITTTTSALPNAAFTASAASVCRGTAISFTDNSTNSPTSWTWTFPSGTPASATTQNVASVIWNTAGTYTVTHTATNASGTGTQTMVITVLATPTVTTTTSAGTICSGNSTTITGSGATTYSWMPGSLTGSPVTVSPTSTTSYTVTGTAANGCTGTATRTITVNASPTVTASSSTTTICSGSSVNLTGGGASTYNWMPGNLNGANQTVTPASTTTYTVTGTAANGCTGTASSTITVNTTPTVTATASTMTVCSGSPTTLTGNGASTYAWMPGSLSGTTVTVSPTANTTYTVTGTSANGCTDNGTITINVTALPSLTVTPTSTTICQGSSTTLVATPTTNSTFSWSPTAGLSAPTSATTNASPTATTTYVCTRTSNTTGCSRSQTVTVTVNPAPTVVPSASSTSICTGNTVTLSATGASTCNWMPGNQNGASVNVTPASSTTYTVTGTGANGCTGTQTIAITVGAQPTVTATSSSPSICTGSSATLTANGTATFNWMPGNISGSSVTVTPVSTTTYTVTGTNSPGCSNTATVTVTVNSLPTVTASAASGSICQGNSTSLTGSGASTYSWMPGSLNGTTVSVTPASGTTYTVTGTDANGCSNTSTVSVNVNTLPTVNAAASSSAICEGSSVQLDATGAFMYNWMPGSLSGATVNDSPMSSTTYTVTGTDVNGCSNTSTVMVTVNTLPSVNATASSAAICEGGSVQLDATGASTYSWMPGSLSGATVNDIPSASTTYTVTGTDGNGCSNTSTVLVTVNSLPSVGATSSSPAVCSGGSVQLDATGATTYSWMPGSFTGATVIDAPVSSTTYTVTGTDGNGCSNSATVSVTVNTPPVVTVTLPTDTFCDVDGPTILSGGSPAGGAYSGPGVMGGSFDPSSVGVGTYTIMYSYTDGNGCSDSASQSVVVDICSGITEENSGIVISAVPNPNNGEFTLTFNCESSDDYVLEIHNTLGQVVYTENLNNFSGQYNGRIDLSAFARGMYTVRLRSTTSETVERIITY